MREKAVGGEMRRERGRGREDRGERRLSDRNSVDGQCEVGMVEEEEV